VRSGTQQIHCQAGREGTAILPPAEKSDKFKWTAEAQAAFADLKRTLSTSPVLVAPHEKEQLLLYIAATTQMVSTALVVEYAEEGKIHRV
jgi:dsDNA-binding SOS-regulon protein